GENQVDVGVVEGVREDSFVQIQNQEEFRENDGPDERQDPASMREIGQPHSSLPIVIATRSTHSMRRWLQATIAMGPGILLLCLTVGRTPGMIWDSVEYCAAAGSIASHGTLVTPLAAGSFDGQFDAAGHVIRSHPLVLWPPGYSL